MRKILSTASGVLRTKIHDTARTRNRARTKPKAGENTTAEPVLITPLQTTAPMPALANPAPTSPPISACELDDGMPSAQVNRFQLIAPINAPKITRSSMISGRDYARSDGLGDMQAKEQKGDEVEEGGPKHRILRRQNPGR